MRKIFSLLTVISLLLFFINCPQQETKEPTLEQKAGAKKSIAALNIAMNQAYTEGQSSPSPGVSNPLLTVQNESINETLDASTWGGSGTITLTGTGSYDDKNTPDNSNDDTFSMNMTLQFNNYSYGGITINGTATMTCTATGSSNVQMSYDASIRVTGDYNMSISIKETVTITETSFSYNATITVDNLTWTESQTVSL